MTSSPHHLSHAIQSVAVLSASWLVFAPGMAQASCAISGSTCTFADENEPAIYTFTGASGSDSTAGGSGPNYTFDLSTDLSFDIPDGTAYQGVYIKQIGGDGSYSGPSAGGNGGNITFDGPTSVDVTIPQDLAISDAAAGILIWTQGGPGTDNNENNGSDGAPAAPVATSHRPVGLRPPTSRSPRQRPRRRTPTTLSASSCALTAVRAAA